MKCYVCHLLNDLLEWHVVKVFKNETDAKAWVEEEPNDRTYEEIEIE